MTKTFTIQVQYSPETRWLYNDEEFARLITEMVDPSFRMLTTGPKPLVTTRQQSEPVQRRD